MNGKRKRNSSLTREDSKLYIVNGVPACINYAIHHEITENGKYASSKFFSNSVNGKYLGIICDQCNKPYNLNDQDS